MQYKKLWLALGIVFFGSFAVLLFYGTKIYQEKPPIPSEIVTDTGEVIYTEEEIKEGQNIWERMGGKKLEQYGDTVHMWLRIGLQMAFIVNWYTSLINGQMRNMEKITMIYRKKTK